MARPSSFNTTSNASRRIPWLIIATLAVVAGVYAGVTTSTAPTGDASAGGDDALKSVQENLVNTLALPADFKTVPAFELIDGQGEPITEAALDGRWTMLFFGFTHCPDVCPVTLSVMNEVVDKLDATDSAPLEVAFISVDPVRDTPQVMGRYVDFFNEDFIGITGELTAINTLTSELGIVAAFTANDDDPDNYTVDHTASMLLIDPQRRLRAKFNAPHEVETIVADYQTLLAALN